MTVKSEDKKQLVCAGPLMLSHEIEFGDYGSVLAEYDFAHTTDGLGVHPDGAGYGEFFPWVPNLAHIARYLADHPETVDALGTAVVGLAHLANNAATPKEYSRFLEALGSVRGLIAAMRGEGGE